MELPCPSITEDIAAYVKQANEDLRLDDKYWRDTTMIDLYQSCISVKVQAQQPRPTMIREIFVKDMDSRADSPL